MTASEIADTQLPCLEVQDTCEKAIGFMDEFKLSHYPVVDGALFVGLIYEEDLFEFDDWGQSIIHSKIRLPHVAVTENKHFLSVVQQFQASNLTCIPVIGEKSQFIGVITLQKIIQVFGSASVVQDMGSVIELELAPNDYYLTEVSRIIESNEVKILGTYIRNFADSNKIILTIKLNKQEVEGVLSHLERFGYKVHASYQLQSQTEEMQDRYDNLMHFLNL